jgi:hypothetical protein
MRRIVISLAVLLVVGLLTADSASAFGRRRSRCGEPCCGQATACGTNTCHRQTRDSCHESACGTCDQTNWTRPTCGPCGHADGYEPDAQHHHRMPAADVQREMPREAPKEMPKAPPPAK